MCFIALVLIMAVCGVRVAVISADERLKEAATSQSQRKVTVNDGRGRIFDCNGLPLTDTETEYVTVVFPCEQGAAVLPGLISGDELKDAIKRLSAGNAVVLSGKLGIKSDGAVSVPINKRYSKGLEHVIGYVDGAGNGVYGIEKGFDDLLKGQALTVTYSTDTAGRMLVGDGYKISGGNENSVMLTINSKIQSIVEQAMSGVDRGAAVVLEAENGKMRAMVSKPCFDQDNVAEYLNNADSPLINRALYPYNVGSVFKPCVAAAALENGFGYYTYTCTGSITHADILFKCNRIYGHGELDLKQAVSLSCNTFFYTLASKVGANRVYNSAEALRFGRALDLGGGIVSQKGKLPDLKTLTESSAALINLSIGQGDLLLSPVAVANLYAAVVNDGEYRLPTLIEGVTEEGIFKANGVSPPTAAMSKSVAQTLKQYLENTLKEGTGSAAYTEGISAGGKTGTAQTGWKDGDRSILNGWFCGFVECESTNYVIVILKEDVKSGSHDCAPIFKEISQKITELS